MAERVTIKGRDGSFGAYLARPATGRGPGVVIIQEIFGVNAVMREVADDYAHAGFFALVPDLFWRLEPGVELTDQTESEWQHAFDLMKRFDGAAGINDIQAAITHLRTVPGCTGRVGAVGYCLGGFLAFLTAARTDSDASVGYYGVNLPAVLGEANALKKPLMLHIAEKDEYTPPAAQAEIETALKGRPLATVYRYPEMDHAFARPGGKHYDKANAGLANSRTMTFFRQHLQ